MVGDLLISCVCVLWVAVCAFRWRITDPKHTGQRRFFAIAAGLGAALFWIFGQMLWGIVGSNPAEPKVETGEDIRVRGK
jgi:hypothetical protein